MTTRDGGTRRRLRRRRPFLERVVVVVVVYVVALVLSACFTSNSSSSSAMAYGVPYASNRPSTNASLSSERLAEGTLTLIGAHVTPFFDVVGPLSTAKGFSFSCAVFLFDDRDNVESGGALVSKMSHPDHPAVAMTIEPRAKKRSSEGKILEEEENVERENDGTDDDGIRVEEKGSAVSFAVTFRKTYAVRKATTNGGSPGEAAASFTLSGKSKRRLVANRWHHVALVVDEDVVSFYMDGILDVEHKLPPNKGLTQRGGLFLSPHALSSNSLDDALSIGGESRERRRWRMSTLKARFEPPSGLKGLVYGPRLRMVFDNDDDEEANADECCYDEEIDDEEDEDDYDIEEQQCDSSKRTTTTHLCGERLSLIHISEPTRPY